MDNTYRSYLAERMPLKERGEEDPRKRIYLDPTRILWKNTSAGCTVVNGSALLKKRSRQISLSKENLCILSNHGDHAGILLDFGQELQGGIEFSIRMIQGDSEAKLRIRFGESASEAMSELGGNGNATNDHACRDQTMTVQKLSMNAVGSTGFRFVRIDLLSENICLSLKSVKAVMIYRDIPYLGSFFCSDPLLNRIWDVGAYTVHLNMQHYIWDGIKRDRLVWVGDLHPEIMTIQTVFGDQEIIRDSLDFSVEETFPGAWINNIPSYSMWWIIIQHDYFWQYGNREYLQKQLPYMKQVCKMLSKCIDSNGKDTTPEMRFIDWATKDDSAATDLGLQALHVLAVKCAKYVFSLFGEAESLALCEADLQKLCAYPVQMSCAKQANALAVWAGLLDAQEVNEKSLKQRGAEGLSAFMGGYILRARAEAGDISESVDVIREYWGGMLKLGATTFWEDFDVNWVKNAAPIDRLPEEHEIDVHGTYGRHCYQRFRHSLCHGWSSGPTSWLSRYVLGIEVIEPGCRKIRVRPNLCGLEFARGTYPTPYGIVELEHLAHSDGSVETVVHAPEEVEVICDN